MKLFKPMIPTKEVKTDPDKTMKPSTVTHSSNHLPHVTLAISANTIPLFSIVPCAPYNGSTHKFKTDSDTLKKVDKYHIFYYIEHNILDVSFVVIKYFWMIFLLPSKYS